MSFDTLFKRFKDAEENEGFAGGGGLLPRGTYPVEVAVIESGCSEDKDTPNARLQLTVTEGPFSGQATWVTVWLPKVADSAFQAAYDEALRNKQQTGKYGARGSDAAKAHRAFTGTATLLKKMGVAPRDVGQGATGSIGEQSLAFWNVEAWDGRTLIVDLGIETAADQEAYDKSVGRAAPASGYRDRQRLNGWHAQDAETMAEWRQKHLATQTKLAEDIKAGRASVVPPAPQRPETMSAQGGGPAVNI